MTEEGYPLKPAKEEPTRVQVRNPHRRALGERTELEDIVKTRARQGTKQTRRVYALRHYEYEASTCGRSNGGQGMQAAKCS